MLTPPGALWESRQLSLLRDATEGAVIESLTHEAFRSPAQADRQ